MHPRYACGVTHPFDSLALSEPLRAVIAELGFTTPTPIQAKGIPVLLEGKDLIGQSSTGSGKTAAFSLPILQRLDLNERVAQALVVCPTRELSAQVARELRTLGRKLEGLVVTTITGGEPFARQSAALERGVHVLVGTPGRLLDHLTRGTLSTQNIVTVILDEADRMLEMGFAADMDKILLKLPATRQTAFFSATFPAAIAEMSRTRQKQPVRITVDDESAAAIRQYALRTAPDERRQALYRVLAEYAPDSALVFCNFKASVAEITRSLAASGASVACLHGDLEQFERDQVLARFRNESVRILVATDVAGRGIDVDDLDLVVNYELPDHADVYVHRVGRTGRAGKQGRAVSLYTSAQKPKLNAIEEFIGVTLQTIAPTSDDVQVLARRFAQPAKMDTLLISGGRKDKVRPGDILGALTGDSGGLAGSDVGKIEIQDRLSYVAVARHVSRAAVASLNRGRIKRKRFRVTLVGR